MSSVKAVPEGYHSLQPYLIFAGAAAAMQFYAKAFGATERLCMKTPEARISHAELAIGDSVVMLADEHPEIGAFSPAHYGGSPISLMLYVDNCDAVYAAALAAGAEGEREPANQPYGDRMCGIKDPFGYRWYIATHTFDVSKEDLEKM